MIMPTSQPRTVFISYAREDEQLILPVANLLRAAGAVVFLDVQEIPYGERWESVLLAQLHAAERILVFWSVNAANSEWVRREYLAAIGAGLRVVPIPLDATPLPVELAAFQALTALVPLVYRARRSQTPLFNWRTSALVILVLVTVLVLPLWLPSNAAGPTEVASHDPQSGSLIWDSFWLIGFLVLMLFGALKWAIPATRWGGKKLQVALYDTIFSGA